ncbi:energy-coupling factor ABC transporter ATP-binding protein [Desulfonema magnum]|uniref:ABC transporter, ATP-binding protein n=1 Tax=Desulfonema magnum TaxID=45655 RepID=A0A975BWR5_9BACT|nr:ABC transporter ATP-binding protein [Desulfonema magnum]QTA93098.1 putative ABC transporter, ATP-binding protein [Desulfonema magnum]
MVRENNLIIHMQDVCFSYPYGGQTILENLNFKLQKGEKLGLIGHNGSGKTTFLHIIMGLLPVSAGIVRILGNEVRTEKDFRVVRQKIGLLFQHADDQLFSPTVLEDVAFGLLNLGKSPAEARELSLKTLEQLNLKGFENRVTHKLSGGEKKLASLATVLVMQPRVLLLDEPTTGLDEATKERIISVLNNLDISYIIVSHEYDFLSRTTNDICTMKDGQIIYNGDSSMLHTHYHSHKMGKVSHEHHNGPI